MDSTPLPAFIAQHRPLIVLVGFDAHLTHNAIYFAIDGGEDYVFSYPLPSSKRSMPPVRTSARTAHTHLGSGLV